MNTTITNFDWGTSLLNWLAVVAAASALGFFFSGVIAGLARGSMVSGFVLAAWRVVGLFQDLVSLSPRRLWGLSRHTWRESWRRRMLWAVMGVFIALFLFAGWFLESRPIEQVKVYASFVFMSSTLIAMLASILIAATGIPSDIREQTIHTVVTKPVRRLEIVLGRILGLTIVTTVILVVMGIVSYVYLRRSVSGNLEQLRTQLAMAQQQGDAKREADLRDDIQQVESKLVARVPIYGKLAFLTETGEIKQTSKNVGYEDTYRSFIEGNKPNGALWQFRGLPVDRLLTGKAIPTELTFTVFRTYKGEIGRGVVAQLSYTNPQTRRQIVDYPFQVREYYVNHQTLDDRPDPGRGYYEDARPLPASAIPSSPLAWLLQGSGGELVIEARCLSSAQYLGMAQPDLYILLQEASFGLDFAKGMVGVWLRVFLIICVAVMFSTFLSAPVAVMATMAVFAGGVCMSFLRDLAAGKAMGGGPVEAMIRLVTHENLVQQLESNFWTHLSQKIDQGWRILLLCLTYVLPDLGTFNTASLVANGFDIPPALLLQNIVTALGYAIPFAIVGYFLFQTREIAR